MQSKINNQLTKQNDVPKFTVSSEDPIRILYEKNKKIETLFTWCRYLLPRRNKCGTMCNFENTKCISFSMISIYDEK